MVLGDKGSVFAELRQNAIMSGGVGGRGERETVFHCDMTTMRDDNQHFL